MTELTMGLEVVLKMKLKFSGLCKSRTYTVYA